MTQLVGALVSVHDVLALLMTLNSLPDPPCSSVRLTGDDCCLIPVDDVMFCVCLSQGRGGKGSIYVWATGNGGSVGDDCSCDGYVSSIYTLSVGCISDHGLSTYFSEVCPSTIAVVFTGGSHKMPGDDDYKAPKIKVVRSLSCTVFH